MDIRKIKILGTGKYLPSNLITAADLAKKIGVSESWILKKSGVEKRYFADGETVSQMGAKAALQALENSGTSLDEIDLIVSAGGVPEQAIPCTAALIQRHLGLEGKGVPAFDINSTCLGFITALDTLSYSIQHGRYKKILIVCADIASTGLNWDDPESCTIFGDGAAAVVISASHTTETSAIITSRHETYCEGADLCRIQGGGSGLHPRHHTPGIDPRFLFEMDGRAVFKMASKTIMNFIDKMLHPLDLSSIDLVIPHQASMMALRIFQKKMHLENHQIMLIAHNHGNVIAASLPLALHEAIMQKRLQRGQKVMLLGTSAGFAIGGIVLEY